MPGAVFLVASLLAVSWPSPVDGRHFATSGAYLHVMRSRLAELDGDLSRADDELRLARAYDSESAYLARELARLRRESKAIARSKPR